MPGREGHARVRRRNRDPDRFERPNDFDIDRDGLSGHLTFGSGRHRCIGEGLARLELTLVLDFLVDHFADLEIDGEGPVGRASEHPRADRPAGAPVIGPERVPYRAPFVIRGRVVEGAGHTAYGARDDLSGALGLNELVWPGDRPAPLFDVPTSEIIDILTVLGDWIRSDPSGVMAEALAWRRFGSGTNLAGVGEMSVSMAPRPADPRGRELDQHVEGVIAAAVSAGR